jgi:hypothetical protein
MADAAPLAFEWHVGAVLDIDPATLRNWAEREEIDSGVRPGHSSYAITADIYSHVGPAQQREAADRLDEALRW